MRLWFGTVVDSDRFPGVVRAGMRVDDLGVGTRFLAVDFIPPMRFLITSPVRTSSGVALTG